MKFPNSVPAENAGALFCFGRFVVVLVSLAAFLAGCVGGDERADLVIINGAEPESLDPAIITGQPDMRVVKCLFEGLTRLDPREARPAPALAERWEMSPDGIRYTFHLRTNAVWSTGEPITSEDVVYSWRRALDPATASDYAAQLFYIKNAEDFNTGKIHDPVAIGVKAVDPHTIEVELVGPTPFFLDLCAFPTLAVVPRFAIEKHGDRWLTMKPLPVNGAYLLDSWRIHDRIRVRKNPRHWDAVNVHCEVVDFLQTDSPNTAMNLYITGQADVVWDKNLVPAELMDVLGKRPDCHTFDYLGSFFYRYNLTKPIFKDFRVRQAMALAVNKRRLVENITKGGEKVADHFTPKGMAIYHPPAGLGYDPELARKLLAAAGYPGGKGFPPVEYLFKTGKTDEQIGVELQDMWLKELGIKVNLRQTEWKVYLAAQSALDFEISRSSWIGDYNDPNTFLDMFMSNNGNNRTGWTNLVYDGLIREANFQTDPKKREAVLQKAETMLIKDELPIVPLYFYAGVTFFDGDKIDGIYPNLLDEHPVYAIWKKAPKVSPGPKR